MSDGALPPLASSRQTALVGSALAAGGAVAYGINIVGARMAASQGVTGSDIVVYRALFLVPVFALLAIALGRRLVLSADERPTVLRFAIFAAVTALFYLSALQYLPVAHAVTIFYSYPLLVILLTPYLDHVRLPLRRWIVAIVACAGVLIAVGPDSHVLDPRGVILAFAGACACAGMFITGARLTTDATVTFFWSQLVALPLGLGFAWLMGGLAEPRQLAVATLPLTITLFGYLIGFFCQITAAPRISAATASLLFLLEPVSAIAGAAVALGEGITPLQGIGMVLVIAALAADLLPSLRPAPSITSGLGT
ncbi:MAG: DMT family transporter [Proteobacteria bacterium]|nr:DMT family transporter [Pseudomonadota bacterium]